MPRRTTSALALLLCFAGSWTHISCANEARHLGEGVLAIQRALADPEAPGSMEAVLALGRDSRHYVMVRGWLGLVLEGDRSIASSRSEDVPEVVRNRIRFVERALRALDLE